MTHYELLHEYETTVLERAGAAARITLNRPERMNACDEQMAFDLRDALGRLHADETIRAVTLTGAGRAFCAGADLASGVPTNDAGDPDLGAALRARYNPVVTALRELPKPVVAVVGGGAVGVGASLALACDLVLMGESAYVLLAFAGVGLVPDGGASALIPARIGLARAAELALLAERLPAERALAWGLVNAVHPDAELAAAAEALVARLAAGPTKAYANMKRLFNAWAYRGLADQLELEAELQQEQALSGDFREGVAAFLQKRAAQFTGV